jgi:hypothetical protein
MRYPRTRARACLTTGLTQTTGTTSLTFTQPL